MTSIYICFFSAENPHVAATLWEYDGYMLCAFLIASFYRLISMSEKEPPTLNIRQISENKHHQTLEEYLLILQVDWTLAVLKSDPEETDTCSPLFSHTCLQ